jgi:hypothetical protein
VKNWLESISNEQHWSEKENIGSRQRRGDSRKLSPVAISHGYCLPVSRSTQRLIGDGSIRSRHSLLFPLLLREGCEATFGQEVGVGFESGRLVTDAVFKKSFPEFRQRLLGRFLVDQLWLRIHEIICLIGNTCSLRCCPATLLPCRMDFRQRYRYADGLRVRAL